MVTITSDSKKNSAPAKANVPAPLQSLPTGSQRRPLPRLQASANSSNPVVEAALTWRGRYFSQAHYGESPYCASFVRWCFVHGLGFEGTLPLVLSPPYYRKLGLVYPPGKWYADSLAGDEVGAVVKHQQPGDILLFRDTDPRFPPATITHVGIATDSLNGMCDAGSGSLVHQRSHQATFPGKLVEIRRPKQLMSALASNVRRTTLVISGGHAFGSCKGRGVQSLGVDVSFSMNGAAKSLQWGISVDGHPVPSVISATVDIVFDGGQHFKLFWHDRLTSGYLNGAAVKEPLSISVDLENGVAHVQVNHKEVKPTSVKFEIVS